MPDSVTVNFNLTKIEVGGSNDTWGTKLNANFDAIDAALFAAMPKDGGTFAGVVSFAAGIQGPLNIAGMVGVSSTVTFGADFSVAGTTTFGGIVAFGPFGGISGNLSITGSLGVASALSVGGTLGVTGASTFGGLASFAVAPSVPAVKVAGQQIIGPRGTGIADATADTLVLTLNRVLDRMRAHGLIDA